MRGTVLQIPDKYRQIVFIILLILCIVFPMESAPNWQWYINAPVALLMGIITAIVMGNPFIKINKKATTYLLQISVVCLGFHLDVQHAMKAGQQGLLFTIATIGLTLIAGYFIGRWLKIEPRTSFLISNGTAICGGSAIAAVAPIVKANDHEMSVSLGTVFILNSIALIIFPAIGHMLALSAEQYGTWCAIAIHDTSSVVGAATNFKDALGHDALPIATAVKLERALWIIPISLITAWHQKSKGKVKIPWFIFLFVVAIIISNYLPVSYKYDGKTLYDYLYVFGRKGLIITLFLIGSGLSINTIRQVGFRPILQGVILWVLIGVLSLLAIRQIVV